MKVFLAFCFFFGSIFLVFVLFLICFLFAPAEYTLDKRVTEISAGDFRYPERIFPDLPKKNRYGYLNGYRLYRQVYVAYCGFNCIVCPSSRSALGPGSLLVGDSIA
jgi:hypothetical protein